MAQKNVSIYTTPTCIYCNQVKAFFKENNIEYQEFDVSVDVEKKKEMIDKSGQMGVPVVAVDDPSDPSGEPEIVVGFDKAKLTKLLEL